MSSGSCVLYYVVAWNDSTVLHCLAEYTAIDDCNIRFGMMAQFYAA